MDVKNKIDKSLSLSIIEGSLYTIMLGFGESLFLAFAVFLNAKSFMLAIISSLPPLLGSLIQIFANDLMNFFGSRKKFAFVFAFLQGIMYIPIALTFFIPDWSVEWALIFISIYFVFGMIISPVWNSWMGDLVYPSIRGSYFAKRSKITGMANLIAMILAGFILQNFKHESGYYYTGFVVVFLVAFFCRTISSFLLLLKYEPDFEHVPSSHFRFSDFLAHFPSKQYGFFVLYMAFISFATFFSAPFFVPYMLTELKFDYLMLTIISAVPILLKFMIMSRWGKACDRFGSHKVLLLTGFFIPSIPILWIFSGNFYFLILVQVYTGFICAGFEISWFNYIFDVTTPRNRASFVSYYNIVMGISNFLGGICGGLFIQSLDTEKIGLMYSPYLLTFFIGGLLRIQVSFLLLHKIRPAANYPDISYLKLLQFIITNKISYFTHEKHR